MQDHRFFSSIAVAVLLILSGAAAAMALTAHNATVPGNGNASAPGVGNPATTTGVQFQQATSLSYVQSNGLRTVNSGGTVSARNTAYITAAEASHVPLQYVYLPASASNVHMQGGVVLPGYLQSPAPFGIGAYGINNVSGKLVPYSYTTAGFSASLNLTSLAPFDVNTFDPNAVSFQLNAVLTDTTIRGMPGYVYWTQNVMQYDSYAHQFRMIDNIWNWTAPNANMSQNPIVSHTANQVPYPDAYIGIGPVVNFVSTPFKLTLSMESAVMGGYDTVFFNYTLEYTNSSSHLRQSIGGVFDEVQFSSASGVQGFVPARASYLVDGGLLAPNGAELDAEAGIVGPGGGSNIDIQSINGTLSLHYLNSTGRFVNVPSAYDIGSDTGETSSGIAVAWQPDGNVTLSSGPSIVYGMWGISPYNGITRYTGVLSPSNAFMFVSPGTAINLSNYGYVPMTTSGAYSFLLPTGSYYQAVLMSVYSVEQGSLAPTENIKLSPDLATGVYTPLYAMDNAQLLYVSASGNGTASNPYLLYNSQPGYISPLFGEFNDYGFSVFSGVMIADTNASVNLNNTPSFEINYENIQTLFYLSFYNNFTGYLTSGIDYLGFVFYNTSNLSVFNASLVSGDIPSDSLAGFYGADMMLWNSTNDLVANSTFIASQYFPNQISLLVYNAPKVNAHNTFFGNYFLPGDVGRKFNDTGIFVQSSGNLFFNNYFGNYIGAVVNTTNLYEGLHSRPAKVSPVDSWNVTSTPASTFSMTVNNIVLSGNILGNSTVGGNFWSSYAPGISPLPFNESGNITSGGDSQPIVLPGPYYPVIFYQTSLPQGHQWYVIMGGVTKSSTGSIIVFEAMPGNYSYGVASAGQYLLFDLFNTLPGNATVFRQGSTNVSNGVGLFILPYFVVTLQETGLPAGYLWAAVAQVTSAGSNSTSLSLDALPGIWNLEYFTFGNYFGYPNYYSYLGGSEYVIFETGGFLDVSFTPVLHRFTIYANGAAPAETWNVTVLLELSSGAVDMGTYNGTGSSLTIQLPYGDYEVIFSSESVTPVYNAQSFTVAFSPPGYTGQSSLSITVLQLIPVTFAITNLPAGTAWTLLVTSSSYPWSGILTVSSSAVTVLIPLGADTYRLIPSNPNYDSYVNDIYVTAPVTINVTLNPSSSAQFTVTFHETGLSKGAQWQVTFNGQTQNSSASSISFTTGTGTFYYQIYAKGSTTPQSSGSVNILGSTTVGVTFSSTGGNSSAYLLDGGLVAVGLIIGGLAAFALLSYSNKRKKGRTQ